jgi:hypothetical protein
MFAGYPQASVCAAEREDSGDDTLELESAHELVEATVRASYGPA